MEAAREASGEPSLAKSGSVECERFSMVLLYINSLFPIVSPIGVFCFATSVKCKQVMSGAVV